MRRYRGRNTWTVDATHHGQTTRWKWSRPAEISEAHSSENTRRENNRLKAFSNVTQPACRGERLRKMIDQFSRWKCGGVQWDEATRDTCVEGQMKGRRKLSTRSRVGSAWKSADFKEGQMLDRNSRLTCNRKAKLCFLFLIINSSRFIVDE